MAACSGHDWLSTGLATAFTSSRVTKGLPASQVDALGP